MTHTRVRVTVIVNKGILELTAPVLCLLSRVERKMAPGYAAVISLILQHVALSIISVTTVAENF